MYDFCKINLYRKVQNSARTLQDKDILNFNRKTKVISKEAYKSHFHLERSEKKYSTLDAKYYVTGRFIGLVNILYLHLSKSTHVPNIFIALKQFRTDTWVKPFTPQF